MPQSKPILKVAVPTPLRRSFDYLVGQHATPPIGSRVRVSFGRQQLVGIVVAHTEISSTPQNKLKAILEVIDSEPLLPNHLFKLLLWAADYYMHPIGDVFTTCLPSLLNKGEPAQLEPEYCWKLTADGQSAFPDLNKNAVKQHKILLWAIDHQGTIQASDLEQLELTPSQLKPLVEKGWLQKEVIKPTPTSHGQTSNSLDLNPEQRHAVESMQKSIGQFQGFLLDGVTGSGKTEVYLQLIEKVLTNQQQVLVLVPEIGLTPQTVQRFKRRFDCDIAMLHSGLTDRQRLNIWLKAKQGLTSIVIGTRSSLFTPFANLGLIVVDEEHDVSYKQQEGFRYSARDLAILRARDEQTPVVLGSATPSMESMYNVNQGKLVHLTLRKRAANAKPPHIKVLDIRQRHLNNGLSQPLLDNMQRHLDNGNQCLVFLNRRGFAPSLMCHGCGWIADCQRCDKHMTLHLQQKRLHCHHCDKQVFMPKQCPECGAEDLFPVGLGTERLEQALINAFPNKKVVRIDRDSTRRKQAMQDYVTAIKNNEVDILVGTQMLAKGHHFPNLTMVAVVDIDGCLFSADFRATERTAQLLTQVAGRAGRADQPGEVVIQTHHPEHPLLLNLFTQDYQSLSQQILAEREAGMLPPYASMALFRAEATTLQYPMQFLKDVSQSLHQITGLDCFGPFPAPMAKRAGKMRAQLLCQAQQRGLIQRALKPVISNIEQLPSARKVRWSIDIDPQDPF
ncbi:primosomal protein N' [Kangiella aquimarina]